MAFTKGINKIYESIRKQPISKRETIFEGFKKDMVNSKGLAFKYNLIDAVKKYEGTLSESQADKFIAFLNKKYASQLNEGYAFIAEEKQLFEKYGVKTEPTDTTSYDRVVSGKTLNEAAIKAIVCNPKALSVKDYVLAERNRIKESYKSIRRRNDINSLNKEIKVIDVFSEGVNKTDRKFIKECLEVIKEKTITDFPTAVERAYKLRILSKKLMKEESERMIFEDETDEEVYQPRQKSNLSGEVYDEEGRVVDAVNDINDQVEKDLEKQYRGKKVDITAPFQYISNANIEVPKDTKAGIVIEFDVNTYPKGKLADRTATNMLTKKKLTNSKGVFLNKFIYQAGIDIFTLHGTVFNVYVTEQIVDADFKKANYIVPAEFMIVLFAKQSISIEEAQQVITQILTQYDAYLPQIIPDELDREGQMEALANEKEGRATSYGKRVGATKYYTDKRGGDLDDTFSDDVFSGTADDSEIAAKMDKQFVGDASNKSPKETNNDLMDDDEFEKQFMSKMKGNKKPENEFFDDEDEEF